MFPRPVFTALFFLSLIAGLNVHAFKIISTSSNTHQNITRAAILQTSADVCKDLILQQGGNFVQPNPLTAESLAEACHSPASASILQIIISYVSISNAWVDSRHVRDAEYHFDDESFEKARNLITQGVSLVKASLKQKNYWYARQQLGETLHTLQDFYSHSNWIELGNRSPYSTLIKPSLPLDNLADVKTPTCSSCDDDCTGNILETIITQKKLTSGYFSLQSSYKPSGKCSHGGLGDLTSLVTPKGGINKDDTMAAHGSLHFVAAGVATAASRDLLQDIRDAAGNVEFLRLMGIFQSSSVLCFVVDTSASMTEEIAEVKRITSFIIDSRRGTVDEPSAYILVPFNDPGFGPVYKTADPDVFKTKVNALSAGGGGADDAEMSLSGLWLALAAAPVASEIFLFTDAEPKDTEMKNRFSKACKFVALPKLPSAKETVDLLHEHVVRIHGMPTVVMSDQGPQFASRFWKAFCQLMGATVNFVLTNPLTNTTRSLSNPVNQVYEDLAVASGGLAIEVPKELLANATSAINGTSVSSLVTIFQIVRDPGTEEPFSFLVDSSVRNLTFYITGNSTQFTITAPSGQSQSSGQSDGSLAVVQSVVNFHMVQVRNSSQPGLWSIYMNSTQPYTLKVTGKSSVNFQFDFVEVYQTPHPGYTVFKGRPRADGNVTLLLSMLGSGSEVPTEVLLVEASGSGFHTGLLEDVGNGDYLVTVTTVPKGEFFVGVFGLTNSSSTSGYNFFQRQSSTRHRASNFTVTAVRNATWFPGQLFSLPFTVATSNSYSKYTVTARNSGQYDMTFPSSLTTGSDGGADGAVELSAPDNTTAGTEVILTIEVTQSGTNDTNYAFLRLAVSRAVAPPAGLALSLWLSALISLQQFIRVIQLATPVPCQSSLPSEPQTSVDQLLQPEAKLPQFKLTEGLTRPVYCGTVINLQRKMPPKNKRVKKDTSGSLSDPVKFKDQDFPKLCQSYISKQEMFIDETFPPDKRSIGTGLLSHSKMAEVVWKRPSELVADPCLIVDGESRFDFAQGELGDCWFLAAIAAVTFQKEVMDQVVPVDQSFGKDYAGMFHFRFWRSGKWVDVVIDDKLPTVDGKLIFLNCKTRNEFWPALLEKAYAKVCGSYKAMQGGYVFNALRDFTGGAYKTYYLSEAPRDLWELMDKAARSKALMGCTTHQGATAANTVLPNGIVEGHAYTVTGVTKVQTQRAEVKLVRVFNPWGEGEWNRDWSDKSPLWGKVREEDRKKWLEEKDDGEFWMSMQDFCRYYYELDICCASSTFLSVPPPAPPAPESRRVQR
ncbi:hypothetical protein AOLI_G00054980 [Acnodon oligacanthus]